VLFGASGAGRSGEKGKQHHGRNQGSSGHGCIISHAPPVRATMKVSSMAILYRYLRHFWKLGAAALVLAAINQVFSLLDPLIFRHIIDSYATRYKEYSIGEFLRGVGVLGAAVGSRSYPAWPKISGLFRQPDHPAGGRASMPMASALAGAALHAV
jgi:hypothetical protein